MEARYGKIRADLEGAEATRDAANAEVAEYEAQLAAVRAEAAGRIDAARQQLEGERADRLAEANAAIAERRSAAATEAEAARLAAAGSVEDAAVAVATRVVELSTGRRPDDAAVRQAVGRRHERGGRHDEPGHHRHRDGGAHRPDPLLDLARGLRDRLRRHRLDPHLRPAVLEGRAARARRRWRPAPAQVQERARRRRGRRGQSRRRGRGDPPGAGRHRRRAGAPAGRRPTRRPRRCSPTGGPASTPRSPTSTPRPTPTSPRRRAGAATSCAPRSPAGVGGGRPGRRRHARRRDPAATHRGLHPARRSGSDQHEQRSPDRRLRPGLFEVARAEGTLDEVEDELFRFARSYESSDELRNALSDDQIPPAKRQAIVEDLLGGKATPTTVQLISMVVGSGHGRDLPAIIDRMVERAASSKDREVAEVRSAVELTADQTQRLARPSPTPPARTSASRSSSTPPCSAASSPPSATPSSTAPSAPTSTS